jgi:hypothetical protein
MQRSVEEIARRHGFSADAGQAMFDALVAGGGAMAQFSHSEFGGAGQWMRGGMTMVGDMFNDDLRRHVDGLCADLVQLMASDPDIASVAVPPRLWWPQALGMPASTGAQNDARYAYFPDRRRLAVDVHGAVKVYDTLDHRIAGFAQQQSSGSSMTFTSQKGVVDVATLPEANADDLD